MTEARIQIRRIALCFLAVLCIISDLSAKETPGFTDRMIASAFRGLGKTFLAVADLERLKGENIAKLNGMDEAKFRSRYSEIYPFLVDLPTAVKLEYRISEKMSKKEALWEIQSATKDKLYRIIDALPDEFIAGHFRAYVKEVSGQSKENVLQQINICWAEMLKRAGLANAKHDNK